MRTGNQRVNPVVWDNNVCHTYWYVLEGQGNVANNIFERGSASRAPASARMDSADSTGLVSGPVPSVALPAGCYVPVASLTGRGCLSPVPTE